MKLCSKRKMNAIKLEIARCFRLMVCTVQPLSRPVPALVDTQLIATNRRLILALTSPLYTKCCHRFVYVRDRVSRWWHSPFVGPASRSTTTVLCAYVLKLFECALVWSRRRRPVNFDPCTWFYYCIVGCMSTQSSVPLVGEVSIFSVRDD